MNAVVIFAILSVLLVVGKILRVRIPFLQRLYLPSSVIGGLVGLDLVACAAFACEFVQHIQVIDETRRAVEGRRPGLDGVHVLEKHLGGLRVVPEVRSLGAMLEFFYFVTLSSDVKDTSPAFPYADAEPLSDPVSWS